MATAANAQMPHYIRFVAFINTSIVELCFNLKQFCCGLYLLYIIHAHICLVLITQLLIKYKYSSSAIREVEYNPVKYNE